MSKCQIITCRVLNLSDSVVSDTGGKTENITNGEILNALHWHHNDHDGVSNHQPHGSLLNRLFRCRSKKTLKLHITGLCVGNFSPGPVNSPHKGPVKRKMFPFDDIIMGRLSTSTLGPYRLGWVEQINLTNPNLSKGDQYTVQGPLLLTWNNLNRSIDMQLHPFHYKVWDEITYPFPNLTGASVQVWEWINSFFPHFSGLVIT